MQLNTPKEQALLCNNAFSANARYWGEASAPSSQRQGRYSEQAASHQNPRPPDQFPDQIAAQDSPPPSPPSFGALRPQFAYDMVGSPDEHTSHPPEGSWAPSCWYVPIHTSARHMHGWCCCSSSWGQSSLAALTRESPGLVDHLRDESIFLIG